jgi:hypothetical protein
MHENVVRGLSSGGGEVLRLWQGNSLFSVQRFGNSSNQDRRHGYATGNIAFLENSVVVRHWPRLAAKDANGWRFDRDSKSCVLDETDGGTRPETLFLDRKAPALMGAPPLLAANGPILSSTERRALAAYVKAARALWDIVDLAELPEDDRHLAMQTFLLRQLFVPLRLTVEFTAEREPSADEFAILEERRYQRRRFEAGRVAMRASPSGTDKFAVGNRLTTQSARRQVILDGLEPHSRAITTDTPRIVILGDPGSGKTTLMRWLATAFLMRKTTDPDLARLPDVTTLPAADWLPVIVRCRDLAKSQLADITIDDVLSQSLAKMELVAADVTILTPVLRRMLESGDILFLIDGLDEIADPQLRSQFCSWIGTLADRFPSALVVTSRLVGYREMKRRLHGGFEHTTISDLTIEQKDNFIDRWCDVTISELSRRKTEAEKLKQAIHNQHRSDRIERMTGNPILLTTLALVQRKVGKLPSKRHKLYWEAVGVLLNWRSDVDEVLDADEALPQLQYVAYAMCDLGVQRLRRDELLALLERVRHDYPHIRPIHRQTPESFLSQLERRTSLVIESGQEQHNGKPVAVYEFRHLTFQEYLAALALIEGRFPGHIRDSSLAERVRPLGGRVTEATNERGFRERQVTENWRETLRLCIACCNDDDVDNAMMAIVSGALNESPGDLDDRKDAGSRDSHDDSVPRAVLAALCLADEPNISEPTAAHVLRRFAARVGPNDGSGVVRTGLDQAAVELGMSVWRSPLQSAILLEFQSAEAPMRSVLGSLSGMVSETECPVDETRRAHWLQEQLMR